VISILLSFQDVLPTTTAHVQQIEANVSSSEFTFTFTVGFMVRFRVSFFSQLSTGKTAVLKVCGQEWITNQACATLLGFHNIMAKISENPLSCLYS
jgi:hypothetical protein